MRAALWTIAASALAITSLWLFGRRGEERSVRTRSETVLASHAPHELGNVEQAHPRATISSVHERALSKRLFFQALAAAQTEPGTAATTVHHSELRSGAALAPLSRTDALAAVRGALPLLSECYEKLLRERPDVGAFDLDVTATIDADPNVGGLISSVELGGSGISQHAELARCLRETLLAVELSGASRAGQATVRFPLRFAPSGAQQAEARPPP